MPAPTLTGFARIALGVALPLTLLSLFVSTSTTVDIVLLSAAAVCLGISWLMTSSEIAHATAAVESRFPGRLQTYKVRRWTSLSAQAERRLRRAMTDPEVLTVASLAPGLSRAADAMLLSRVEGAITIVWMVVAGFN